MRSGTPPSGSTLIEVLMALIIMLSVAPILTRFLRSNSQQHWSGMTQVILQEQAREMARYLMNDLAASRLSSLGNPVHNSGFEDPIDGLASSLPDYWSDPSPASGHAVNRSTATAEVRSGEYALHLLNQSSTAEARSASATLPSGGTYLFGFWGHSLDTTKPISAELRYTADNSPITTLIDSTSTNWSFLSQSVSLNAGDAVYAAVDLTDLNTAGAADALCLCPASMTFSSVATPYFGFLRQSTESGFEFDAYLNLNSTTTWRHHRIRFDPVRGALFREYWDGVNWQLLPGFQPIAEGVSSLVIVIDNGQSIHLTLRVLQAVLGGTGSETYELTTSIRPAIP